MSQEEDKPIFHLSRKARATLVVVVLAFIALIYYLIHVGALSQSLVNVIPFYLSLFLFVTYTVLLVLEKTKRSGRIKL
jgi:hypothetical protein